MKKINKSDPCFIVDRKLDTFMCFFWGDFRDKEKEKPSGVDFIVVFDEIFLSFDRYKDILRFQYSILNDNRSVELFREYEYLLLPYNDRKFNTFNNQLTYIKKRKQNFEKWFNRSVYFSGEFIKFDNTKYCQYILDNGILKIFIYYFLKVFYILKWISKLFGYPVIFIKESISTSYVTFVDFKTDKSEYERHLSYSRTYSYLAGNDADHQLKINELEQKTKSSRDKFLESGKFITTLVASIITISLSITIGLYSSISKDRIINQKNNDIESNKKTITILEDKNDNCEKRLILTTQDSLNLEKSLKESTPFI